MLATPFTSVKRRMRICKLQKTGMRVWRHQVKLLCMTGPVAVCVVTPVQPASNARCEDSSRKKPFSTSPMPI